MYRRVTLAAIAAAAAVVGIGAAPAVAVDSANTNVTFVIAAGGLTITAPTSVNLGNGVSGGNLSAPMGPVKVTDQRGLLVAAWTATVSSTAYTTGGGTTAETIPASDATYNPGLVPTATTGLPVSVPGVPGTLSSTPRTAWSATAVGSNSVTWTPNLSIAVPAAAVIGTYTGTVTHSVA